MTDKIKIPNPDFSDLEARLLMHLYDHPTWDSGAYHLSTQLFPEIPSFSPEALAAFDDIRNATESLVLADVARGERGTGANGAYYATLKLTAKGHRKAIEEKRRIKSILVDMPRPNYETRKDPPKPDFE